MHVSLRRLWIESIELLFHLEHVQSGNTQDLGLSTLKERRTVNARDHSNFGREFANIAEPTTIDAHLVTKNTKANQLLRDRFECRRNFAFATFELRSKGSFNAILDAINFCFANLLASNGHCLLKLCRDST